MIKGWIIRKIEEKRFSEQKANIYKLAMQRMSKYRSAQLAHHTPAKINQPRMNYTPTQMLNTIHDLKIHNANLIVWAKKAQSFIDKSKESFNYSEATNLVENLRELINK